MRWSGRIQRHKSWRSGRGSFCSPRSGLGVDETARKLGIWRKTARSLAPPLAGRAMQPPASPRVCATPLDPARRRYLRRSKSARSSPCLVRSRTLDIPISHWSQSELARQAVDAASSEASRTARSGAFLKGADIKPHRIRYWLTPNQTRPSTRSAPISATSIRPRPPRPNKVCQTVSIDEMTGIQALERAAKSLPMKPGHVERREFEYVRHGTKALIAAFDVATGTVRGIDRRYPHRGGFRRLYEGPVRLRAADRAVASRLRQPQYPYV